MRLIKLKKTLFSLSLIIRNNLFLFNLINRIPQLRYRYERILIALVKENQKKEIRVKIINGIKMLLTLKDWVQRNLFIYSHYELPETIFWLNFTKNKHVIFDIGTNVGYFSLLASGNISKSNGVIYAFEPITRTFDRAKYNIELNGFKNIILNKTAITDKEGTLPINIGNEENWGMSSVNQHKYLSGNNELVNACTIDNFVLKNNIKELNIIKIDVEGSEFSVLKGMNNTLLKMRPTILVEILDINLNKSSTTKEEVFYYLWDKDYVAFKIINGLTLEVITVPISFDGLICFQPKEKKFDTIFKII